MRERLRDLGRWQLVLPQFVLGFLGMPRRYHSYDPEFGLLNAFSTGGAAVLAVAYFLPLGYLGVSLLRGPRASANPWAASGLEWQTSSPPPTHNFLQTPRVDGGPYAYSPSQAEAEAEAEARA